MAENDNIRDSVKVLASHFKIAATHFKGDANHEAVADIIKGVETLAHDETNPHLSLAGQLPLQLSASERTFLNTQFAEVAAELIEKTPRSIVRVVPTTGLEMSNKLYTAAQDRKLIL